MNCLIEIDIRKVLYAKQIRGVLIDDHSSLTPTFLSTIESDLLAAMDDLHQGKNIYYIDFYASSQHGHRLWYLTNHFIVGSKLF